MSTVIVTSPQQIQAFRLLALKGAFTLELKGLRRSRRGPSAYAIVKREFSLTGGKQAVYDAFISILKERGILA